MKILSSFTLPQAIPDANDFVSSVDLYKNNPSLWVHKLQVDRSLKTEASVTTQNKHNPYNPSWWSNVFWSKTIGVWEKYYTNK